MSDVQGTGRSFRLTEELFDELQLAADSPESLVRILGLSTFELSVALSQEIFTEDERKCLEDLSDAAFAQEQMRQEETLACLLEQTASNTGEEQFQVALLESVQRVWLAGLGALAVAGEEGARAFSRLVDRGKHITEKSPLHRSGVASQDDISVLSERIEELSSKIQELQDKQLRLAATQPAAPAAAELPSVQQFPPAARWNG